MVSSLNKLTYRFILAIGIVLVIAFSVLLTYMTRRQHDLVIGQAKHQARMLHHQLVLTREWISDHNGLFITQTERPRTPTPS